MEAESWKLAIVIVRRFDQIAHSQAHKWPKCRFQQLSESWPTVMGQFVSLVDFSFILFKSKSILTHSFRRFYELCVELNSTDYISSKWLRKISESISFSFFITYDWTRFSSLLSTTLHVVYGIYEKCVKRFLRRAFKLEVVWVNWFMKTMFNGPKFE